MMKKVAFIFNPISGTGHKWEIIAYLKKVFVPQAGYHAEYYTTRGPGDACTAARRFVDLQYDIVVAIGGDGTVNQVAKGLIGSETKLAVIPVGSGNGLARHLNIPLSYHKAVEAILDENCKLIDAGKINEEVFFCTAGLGFEAVIGDRFNHAGSRGLFTYMEFCAREYVRYRSEEYEIEISGNRFRQEAFLITFANCAQWGNNAFIAPDANVSDGMVDVVVWKQAPAVAMPLLTAGLFLKTLKFSEFVDIYRCRELHIRRADAGLIQFDGESRSMGKDISVSVLHHAVAVIVPSVAEWDPLGQMKYVVPQLREILPILKDMIK